MIVDELLKFRLKMMILMKFDGKYAICNGMTCMVRIMSNFLNGTPTCKIFDDDDVMKKKKK